MDYLEETEPYVIKTDKIIKSLINTLSPLYNKEYPIGQDVTVPLFTMLHSTSESILILLMNHSIYDADVLLRTLMDGTVRYCYLMRGDINEREDRLKEYKVILTEIDDLIDHKKAKETIEILKKYPNTYIKPFESMLLSDSEFSNLEQKYPSKIRNQIKGKWGYQSILRKLADDESQYETLLATLSTYALNSHYCHFDWTGVSSMKERIKKTALSESDDFDIAHALRITSNVLSLYLFRASEYMRLNNKITDEAVTLSLEGLKLIEEMDFKSIKIIDIQLS